VPLQTWVDPAVWGKVHPEWFGGSQQLCYSSPTLLQYLTARAREFLAGSPNATIITLAQASVTLLLTPAEAPFIAPLPLHCLQNDNQDYCQTPPELAIIEAEGGAPSGPLLRAINFIAANLSADFPGIAVDTLAYQYTRKAPNTTVPLSNVIVRLCDIEANFGVPLSDATDPTNAAFATDLRAWAAISKRLYIWDYVVDFSNTVMPWPNYFMVRKVSVHVLLVCHCNDCRGYMMHVPALTYNLHACRWARTSASSLLTASAVSLRKAITGALAATCKS
jgi:hypothetical protein